MSRILKQFADWQMNKLTKLFREFGINESESVEIAYAIALLINTLLYLWCFFAVGALLWNHMVDVINLNYPATSASPVVSYGTVADVVAEVLRSFISAFGMLALLAMLIFAFNVDAILVLIAAIITLGTVLLAAVVVIVELVRTRKLGG